MKLESYIAVNIKSSEPVNIKFTVNQNTIIDDNIADGEHKFPFLLDDGDLLSEKVNDFKFSVSNTSDDSMVRITEFYIDDIMLVSPTQTLEYFDDTGYFKPHGSRKKNSFTVFIGVDGTLHFSITCPTHFWSIYNNKTIML